MTALGKALEPAFRSKLERDYAAHLELQIAAVHFHVSRCGVAQ